MLPLRPLCLFVLGLIHCWCLCWGLGLQAVAAPASPQATSPTTISAAAYRAQLQSAEAALRTMENSSQRPLKAILQKLAKTQTVQRDDGVTMTAGGDEWQRRANEINGAATRQQVSAVREAIRLRLKALNEWIQPRPGSTAQAGEYYQSADAQTIISQLEASGQIRTGPTRAEQLWANFIRTVTDLFRKLVSWIGSFFPNASSSKAAPTTIDPRWIWFFFISTVLALLGTVGFFIWRAIGGRWQRAATRREVRFVEGEDAELLRLPPDELRDRAHQLARDGNFREALRHLYIALLLRLDARGIWRYDSHRTNWEHIAALQTNAAGASLVQPLSDLTHRFDRVRYGNALCTSQDWTHFEQDVTALEGTLGGNTSVAVSKNVRTQDSGGAAS